MELARGETPGRRSTFRESGFQPDGWLLFVALPKVQPSRKNRGTQRLLGAVPEWHSGLVPLVPQTARHSRRRNVHAGSKMPTLKTAHGTFVTRKSLSVIPRIKANIP